MDSALDKNFPTERPNADGGAQGREANRLHGDFDEHVPGGGFYSAAVHGWADWAPVPRVCSDAEFGNYRFRRHFADANAHVMLAFLARGSHLRGAWNVLPRLRARVQRSVGKL